jgi:hypothetical protein
MTTNPGTPSSSDLALTSAADPTPSTNGLSRRSILAGLGAGSFGLFAAPSLLGHGAAANAATLPSIRGKSPRPGKTSRPGKQLVRDTDGSFVQPGPFSIQASCELSDDFFLTDEVVLGATDKVIPFTTESGTVEALVLTGVDAGAGLLSYLQRDPSATSGWSYTSNLPLPVTPVRLAAVSSVAGQPPVLMVFCGDPSGFGTLSTAWLELGPDGWQLINQSQALPPSGPFMAGRAPDGSPYFYGWRAGNIGSTVTTTFEVWTTSALVSTPVLSYASKAGTQVDNAVMLYDPSGKDGSIVAYSTYGNTSRIDAFVQVSGTGFTPTPVPVSTANPGDLMTAFGGSTPAVLYQDSTGDIMITNPDSGADGATVTLWQDSGVEVGDGQVATWQQDDRYTFVVLDAQVANVITQLPPSGLELFAFTQPIPLLPGLERVYSVATDPAQATLFVVDVDNVLSILTKDPTAGWSQNVVHQDGATSQSVSSWRTQIKILDANQCGVGAGQISLATDRPVGLWQPTGSTILLPGAPVTLAADLGGTVTVSIPAAELDTAVLTAQALDANGDNSGEPFRIIPNTDVQNFLAGQGSLADLGKLNGSGLVAATAPVDPSQPLGARKTVFPNLTSDGSTAVAAAISHVATLGLAPSAAIEGVQSALFDLTTSPPTFQTSANPSEFNAVHAALGVTDWWDSAKNDFESAYHGLRHDAIKFKKMVSSWDKDATNWVVALTVEIGNDIESVITYVISDIKTAIHAISSFFQALGADLDTAWNWLKHNVIELVKNADANATILRSWFTPFFTTVTSTINAIDISADDFFTNLQTRANAEISKLAASVETYEFGTSAPLPPPTPDTGSNDADLLFTDAKDVITFFRHSSANWLLDKLRSYLPATPSDGGPDFPDPDQVILDLITDITDSLTLIESIAMLLWDGVEPFLKDAGTLNATSMGDFFAALETTVDDGLTLVQQLLQTVLDSIEYAVSALQALIDYEYQAVPVVGELLDMAGVDTTLSIEHLLSLVVAYPTTLINQILNDGALFPPDNTPPAVGQLTKAGKAKGVQNAELGSSRVDPWAVGLGWTSVAVQAVWTANDFYLDMSASKENEDPSNLLTTTLDIVCPVILTLLQWPSPASDSGLTQPFWAGTNDKGSGTDLIPWMAFTAFIPPTSGIIAAVGSYKELPEASDFSDYGVPVACYASGIANTVLSSLYGSDQGVPWDEIAFGVLANISYDIAPLGFPALNEGTDDLAAAAKVIADVIGNGGTTMSLSAQAIIASFKPLVPRMPIG